MSNGKYRRAPPVRTPHIHLATETSLLMRDENQTGAGQEVKQ